MHYIYETFMIFFFFVACFPWSLSYGKEQTFCLNLLLSFIKERKKVMWVWNNMRAIKWWQTFHLLQQCWYGVQNIL